jgi:protein-glutamine gamma-glutamyltransferase
MQPGMKKSIQYRLAHLARPTRDTLFLLVVMGWTVLPHLLHLPFWCTLLSVSAMLWRAKLALRLDALPSKKILGVILISALALTWWSFHTLLGKEPGVALLIVLVALKMLELRAKRDAFVVFFLGFFLVLTHFLYSQSFVLAVAVLLCIWGLLTALVLAHMPVGKPTLRQASRLAQRMMLFGAPLMLILFFLFPRFGPLWGGLAPGQARTGLSNVMSIGSVAQLAQDDQIAMRIKFFTSPPPPQQLYFRGPVLSEFDGQQWYAAPTRRLEPTNGWEDILQTLKMQGPATRYEVTLEPMALSIVPLLEATPEVSGNSNDIMLTQQPDFSWHSRRALDNERLRLSGSAYLSFTMGQLPDTIDSTKAVLELRRQGLLRLPTGISPRLQLWAKNLANEPRHANANATQLAQAVMAHIREQGYTYTLAPGLYGETNRLAALDEFWFDRKEGFCEHFAASFVIIMRTMNIPARVVTGYQGTDAEQQDGYHVVRQSAAHAWAEYWQAERGWVRADPTWAVAPERIERSRPPLPASNIFSQAIGAVNSQWLSSVRSTWETMNNRWNQWVLNYAQGQQLELLKKLGFSTPDVKDAIKLALLSLSSLALIGTLFIWRPWLRKRRSQSALNALAQTLRGLNLRALPHETPRQWAQQISTHFGARGEPLAQLLLALELQRYGSQATIDLNQTWYRPWLKNVRVEIKELKKLPLYPSELNKTA